LQIGDIIELSAMRFQEISRKTRQSLFFSLLAGNRLRADLFAGTACTTSYSLDLGRISVAHNIAAYRRDFPGFALTQEAPP
jgi:hypothetical protein